MKKVLTFLLCTLLFLGAAGCAKSEKTPAVADIMKEIRAGDIDLPDMAEIPIERISGYYDISSDDIIELEYIIAGSGATPDEIMIVKAADDSVAKEIGDKMEDRKTQISDLFSTYNPDEMSKVNSCVIEVKNEYAFFAICNDNDKAKKIFDSAF